MNKRFDDTDLFVPHYLSSGGEMGVRMRAYDWSTSPLGSPDIWDGSLRSTVGLMLASKFPMFVAWGPDLGFLYNDAYASILGRKHPNALGRPFAEVWSEIWPDISPLVETALAGEATWLENLPLLMHRNGYDEETFFTFSYSPAFNDEGQVVGVFCACTETTDRVLADRRLDAERERQRRMLRQMPGFVGMLSGPDLVYEYVNDAYVEISERTDFIGRPFLEVFPDLEGQDFHKVFADAYRTGETAVIRGMQLRLHGRPDTQYIDFVIEPVRNDDGIVVGLFVGGYETTDAYRSEAHLNMMVDELNHRVKNTLSTVQAIAGQTFRDGATFENSKVDFNARLLALANVHNVLTEENWAGANLRQVIDRTVGPHGENSGPRFNINGPHVLVNPKTALSLSMAIHELCTNAAKYGALSVADGRVEIVWRVEGESENRRFLLTWTEKGGPPVAPPSRKGFGSRLVERSLAAELDGVVEIRYEPAGVVCTIDAPVPSIA